MRRGLHGLMLWCIIALGGIAYAQPALLVGSSTVDVGQTALLSVQFDSGGATVAGLDVRIRIDDSVFSSAEIACSGGLRCYRGREGDLRIMGVNLPSGRATIGGIRLAVAIDAGPGQYSVPIAAESYLDADGMSITPGNSSSGFVDVNVPFPTPAMSLARGGHGSALVYPYFTVRDGVASVFVLANRSPFAKAVRVNVLEGLNGRIVASWNAYMAPNERVRFLIGANDATDGATVQSGGCTFPPFPGGGRPLDAQAYADDAAANLPSRVREGFVQAIALADLDNMAAADFQAGCGVLLERFQPSVGVWATNDITANTTVPRGVIAGVSSLRGVRGRVPIDRVATAIRNFSNQNLHAAPADVVDLNSGNVRADLGRSTAKGAVIVPGFSFASSAEAVSALLITDRMTLPARAAGTEWVFTAPTKPYFTDPGVAPGRPPIDPFTSILGNAGACEPAAVEFPGLLNVTRNLCFVTSSLSFDGRNLFDSRLNAQPIDIMTNRFGGISFSGRMTDINNNLRLTGLPMLGMAIAYRTGVTPRSRRLDLSLAASTKGPMPAQAGRSVMVRGRLVFVGIPGAAGGRGQVLVYRRHGSVLVPEAALEASPGLLSAGFGGAMDVSDNLLAVGASGDTGMAKGSVMQGAIFERLANGEWNTKYEFTDVAAADAEFGSSVALEGNTVAFGAPGDDQVVEDGGAVYVFDVDGGLIGTSLPGADALIGSFGASTKISNGVLAVGSPTGGALLGAAMGAVSMYDLIGQNLNSPFATQLGTEAGDGFGASIALSGNLMVAGAPGFNGSEGDAQGAAFTFNVTPEALQFAAQLNPAGVGDTGLFGSSVSISPSTGALAIGAPGALGSEGASGAVYTYAPIEDQYQEVARISAEETGLDAFGSAVEIDGDDIIIGAPQADGSLGAAVLVSDIETLFFDDFETLLFR